MIAVAAISRGNIADYVSAVFFVFIALIFIHLLLGLLFSFGLRMPYARWTNAVLSFLREIAEPYLRLFRRFIPSLGGLDLSPMLAIILLYVLRTVIVGVIR